MRNPKIRFFQSSGVPFKDWKTSQIKDVCSISKEVINPKDFPSRTFVEYSMPAFDNNQTPYLRKGNELDSLRLSIRGDVILFNKLNIKKKRIWNVKNPENNSLCSAEFLPLTSGIHCQDFIFYYLSTSKFTCKLNTKSSGTSNSQKRIRPEDLENEEIAIPCLEEQQKIASFFSTLDQKIELNERKLEFLEKLKKGLMQKIFNQEIRFKSKSGKNFPNWIKKPLHSVIASSGGHTPNMKNKALWEPGEYFWVTPKDMKSEYVFSSEMKISELGLKELKLHEPRTILLVARSGVLKHTLPLAFLRIQATINQDLKAISVTDEIISGYLFFFLQSKSNLILNNYVKTGTTVQSIMMNDFYAMMVDIPCLEEQRQIAATLFIFNEKIGIMTQKIAILKQLKQGFMQQMFV